MTIDWIHGRNFAQPGSKAEPSMKTIQRSLRLSDVAAESIRAEIVSGRLAPNSRITISNVAQILGTSNTPVREALVRLAEAGLVQFDGAAVRIVGATDENIIQAFELRAQLESMTARLAAQRRSPEEADALVDLALASQKAAADGDREAFYAYDGAFHKSIAAVAKNTFLEKYASNAYDLATVLRNVRRAPEQFHARASHMHIQIADAVKKQDEELAESLGSEHVKTVLLYLEGSSEAQSHNTETRE